MKLEELTARLDARTRPRQTSPEAKTRGRKNGSTGIRGISAKMEKTGRLVYCVFTATAPAIYIGRAKTLEQAIQMQADFIPTVEPLDCSHIVGVRWVQNGYRGSVTIRGECFKKNGFKTPEEALAWRNQIIAEHQ